MGWLPKRDEINCFIVSRLDQLWEGDAQRTGFSGKVNVGIIVDRLAAALFNDKLKCRNRSKLE